MPAKTSRSHRAERKSKATQTRKRNQRTDDLYYRGLRPPEITDILIDEKFYDPRQRAYALRVVQARVKEIRGDAPADKILKLQRPAEAERARRQLYKILGELRDIYEDDSEVTRDVVTPKGDVVTTREPKWPPNVKQKALKDAVAIIEKIANLNSVDVKTGLTDSPDELPDGKPAENTPFVFKFSGRLVESLIAERIGDGGDVN